MPDDQRTLDLMDDLIRRAKAAGADQADALLVRSDSVNLTQRLGEPEHLERSESRDLGLRVLVGRRQAVASSTDLSAEALSDLVERAMAMARVVPEDPYCGLAEPDQITAGWPNTDSDAGVEPSADRLREWAAAAEDAARAVSGVTNSEGGSASFGRAGIALVASNGFSGAYDVTSHGISAVVVAGEGTAMERDYDFTSAVHAEDLRDPVEVGRSAGERAVRRLGARKPATVQVPVIYDPRVSGGLIGHLASALSGTAVARGTSFLKDRMGEAVLADGLTVVDDPHRARGLRSKPFDGEGVGNRRRDVVKDGVLTSWFLDLRTARQLGLETTGHAARGTSGPPSPSPTNLYLEPGSVTPEALIAGVADGFYVTDLMGFGINMVTGDYSRGAAGFWIKDGRLGDPINEATVAGNLKDMFRALTPANDLVFRYGTNAPTVRVDGMTVAGA